MNLTADISSYLQCMHSIITPTFTLHTSVRTNHFASRMMLIYSSGVASALQSFALGAGHSMLVPHYSRSFPMPTKLTSHEWVNEKEVSIWSPEGPTGGQCLWEWHGVWGWDRSKKEAIVLRENYFVKHPMTGKEVRMSLCKIYPIIHQMLHCYDRLTGTPTTTTLSLQNGPRSFALFHRQIRLYSPKRYRMRYGT